MPAGYMPTEMDPGDIDYDRLYERAKQSIPSSVRSEERLKLPDAELFFEGKTTIFRNFRTIVETLRRDEKHLLAYLLRDLGTAGHIEDGRLVFKARVPQDAIAARIQEYVSRYVLCTECGRPDTHLTKADRVQILVCEACGASRPITGGKIKPKKEEKRVLREGDVLDVLITDTGRRGDGIAHVANYTVFVTGARKGDRAKVKIMKISRLNAFSVRVG